MGANPKFVVEDREDWTRVMWNGALGACVYVPRYMQEELALALAPQLAARVESLEADLKFARDGWKIMETQRDEAHAAVDRMKAEQAAHDADVRANGDAVIAGLNAKVAELRADLANMTEQYKSAKDYCDKADTLRFEAEAALEAAKNERNAAMVEAANLKASIEWRDETNAKLRVRLAERSDELVKRAALIEEARKEAAEAKAAFDAHVERANAAVKRAVEMETARDVANMIAAHAKSYAADFDRCAGALQAAEKLVEELRGVAAESTSRLLRAEKAEARADGMERAGAEQARRADQNQADMVAWRTRAEAAEARVKELSSAILVMNAANAAAAHKARMKELETAQANVSGTADDVAGVLNAVGAEVQQARANWPAFNSAHEGFAVLAEEVDELWDHVKTNQKRRDLEKMRKEAVQVAAMGVRFALEVCGEERGRK